MERCGSSGIFTGSHGTLQDGIRSDRGAVPSDPGEKVWGLGPVDGFCGRVLGAFAAAMAAVNLGTVSMYTQAEDSYIAWAGETGYTFAELLHRPLHVLKMCYDTLAWKGTQLFEGMIGGSLGNQDPVLNTPTVIILALCTILVVLALKKREKK